METALQSERSRVFTPTICRILIIHKQEVSQQTVSAAQGADIICVCIFYIYVQTVHIYVYVLV